MPLIVMQHETPDPIHVRLFGPDAVVLPADPVSDLVLQTGLSFTHTDFQRCACFLVLGGTIIHPSGLILCPQIRASLVVMMPGTKDLMYQCQSAVAALHGGHRRSIVQHEGESNVNETEF